MAAQTTGNQVSSTPVVLGVCLWQHRPQVTSTPVVLGVVCDSTDHR